MLTHRVLVVPEKIGNVSDRHAFLQKDSREGVAEPVRSRGLLKRTGQIENAVDLPAPEIGHRLEPVRLSDDKRPRSALLRQLPQPLAKPVGNPGEHVAAVSWRGEKAHCLEVG